MEGCWDKGWALRGWGGKRRGICPWKYWGRGRQLQKHSFDGFDSLFLFWRWHRSWSSVPLPLSFPPRFTPYFPFPFPTPPFVFIIPKKKKIWGGRGRERGKGGIDQNIPFGRRENKRIYGVVSRVLYTPGERRGTKRKNEDGMGWDGVGIGSSCVKGDSSVL